MNRSRWKAGQLQRRHLRVRRRVVGTSQRPRLSVHRSNRNLLCQVVNDWEGRTLVAASSLEKEFRAKHPRANRIGAEELGVILAERAQKAGISKVVFDRGGYPYHGRIKAVADGARKG
ncbi:MAG: 50S ribosomal protein L18, partial [Planctomycetes bacterium]|nr:50S ribosomal protein L18 [Planctomycetota bacterium]